MNQRAISFRKQTTGELRISYFGFSWTAMFFTPILQIFRKDLKGFILFFVVYYVYGAYVFPTVVAQFSELIGCITQLLLWIFAGMSYNKIHILILLNSGYLPELEEETAFLREKGFYVKNEKKGTV